MADTPYMKNLVSWIGAFGYFGAFLAGIMFVSVFTIAPAFVILFYLAQSLNPYLIALSAGLGGVLGDYLILKFLKDRIFTELKPLFLNHGGRPLKKLFKTPHFAWALPIMGAMIIVSPFPDELGIGMLGFSKIKTWQFLGLTFVLDALGIFIIIMASQAF